MRKVSKSAIREVISEALRLKNPEFVFEDYGGRITGSVISSTFSGKPDHKRQKLIWDALETAFGSDVVKKIGLVLAYTPEEWNINDIMDDAAMGQIDAPTRRK